MQLTAPLEQGLLFRQQRPVYPWASDPHGAFHAWARTHAYRESTITVKRSMWMQFLRWLEGSPWTLASLPPEGIVRFFDERGIVKDQRYRYVKLLDQVYSSMQLTASARNPAKDMLRRREWRARNDATFVLDADDRHRLKTYLLARTEGLARACEIDTSGWKKNQRAATGFDDLAAALVWVEAWRVAAVRVDEDAWRQMRDLAFAAACFGAGLKEGEARGLAVNCMAGLTLQVPRTARADAHQVHLLDFAQPIFMAWIGVRLAQPCPVLFPAWSLFTDVPSTAPMHAASAYRAARDVVQAAGVSGAAKGVGLACGRWGPQTLRNAFAAEHFARSTDIAATLATLTSAMGYATHAERADGIANLYAAWCRGANIRA